MITNNKNNFQKYLEEKYISGVYGISEGLNNNENLAYNVADVFGLDKDNLIDNKLNRKMIGDK